jgi:hypothetical protein
MTDPDVTAAKLEALRERNPGIRFAVDDFGTGYSSLSYLKRLPIDTLKIDRSFVRELETSSDNAAIVAAIIAMSKSLKLRVVAEGVETQGQMGRLFEQGCQLMQGFLFSPAVPGDDFPAMAKAAMGQTHWRVSFGPRRGVMPPDSSPGGHSNGRHHGALDGELVGPPRPALSQPAHTMEPPVLDDEPPGSQKDRAVRWANRFIGRDG